MKKICLSILILLSVSLNAQDLTYSNKKENTDIKFVDGKIAFWDVMISKSRMTFAGGFGAKLYLNGFYLGLNYDYHYLDGLAEASSSENIKGSSIYAPTKSRNADITVGYFKQKEKEGKVKIFLKGVGRTKYYALIDAKYNKFFGAQIGYKSGFSHLTIPTGVAVKDYYANTNVTTDGGMSTFMRYGWISFGPSYGKIVDVEADFKGYGVKKRRDFFKIYANCIIAATTSLEDVYYTQANNTSKTLVNQYVLQGNVVMSNIGFNAGIEEHKFAGVGLIYGIEGGLLPGVKKGGNIYIAIKWGMIIGKAFGGK
ncbi:MAG TPA: hypothetical protein VN026_07135 [Bacteroidia bacterium]|jgi:hypothetical protein|nr:hypothetical protein [Bacteroidia bacterium]